MRLNLSAFVMIAVAVVSCRDALGSDQPLGLVNLARMNNTSAETIETISKEQDRGKKLDGLRSLRQEFSSALSSSKDALADMNIEMVRNQAIKSDLDARISAVSALSLQAGATRDKLEIIIRNAEAELKKSREKRDQTDGDKSFQSELELKIAERNAEKEELKSKLETLSAMQQKNSEIDERSITLKQMRALLEGEISKGNGTFSKVEDLVGQTLNIAVADQKYTLNATIVFGLLVGAVIVGFFSIAIITPSVREHVFMGQFGIQFVTLFSLIIAIILFGVLKILEGRELAALLGGLSGYILGRTSDGNRIVTVNPVVPNQPTAN